MTSVIPAPIYLSPGAWAKKCGKSSTRACILCLEGRVPGLVTYRKPSGDSGLLIPIGTPWPESKRRGRPVGVVEGRPRRKMFVAGRMEPREQPKPPQATTQGYSGTLRGGYR